MPDYSVNEYNKSRIADFRNVLYWNPSIKTNTNGKAVITFYTGDNIDNFVIYCNLFQGEKET